MTTQIIDGVPTNILVTPGIKDQTITYPNPIISPGVFNLDTYDVSISTEGTIALVVITGKWLGRENLAFTITYDNVIHEIIDATVTSPEDVTRIESQTAISVVFVIVGFSGRYIFTISPLLNSVLTIPSVLLLPGSSPENPPFIEITNLELTSNNKIICRLGFNVITANGICPDCNITRAQDFFTFYNLNFQPLLKPGVTLDFNLLNYAILRFILSGLFCVAPFNKFDVNLLKRRYYQDFLEVLAKSQFRSALVFFTDPQYGFVNSYRRFIC